MDKKQDTDTLYLGLGVNEPGKFWRLFFISCFLFSFSLLLPQLMYGGSINAHSKTCSYLTAALSHVKSLSIPLFINPSQEGLYSVKVLHASLSACRLLTVRVRMGTNNNSKFIVLPVNSARL